MTSDLSCKKITKWGKTVESECTFFFLFHSKVNKTLEDTFQFTIKKIYTQQPKSLATGFSSYFLRNFKEFKCRKMEDMDTFYKLVATSYFRHIEELSFDCLQGVAIEFCMETTITLF